MLDCYTKPWKTDLEKIGKKSMPCACGTFQYQILVWYIVMVAIATVIQDPDYAYKKTGSKGEQPLARNNCLTHSHLVVSILHRLSRFVLCKLPVN